MFTRRGFLAAAASTALLPRLAVAQQATEKSAVVIIFFSGSYNAIFSAADVYVPHGQFAVTGDNVLDTGGGVVVDRATMGALPPEVLAKLCTAGVAHGYSDHVGGPRQFFIDDRAQSYPLQLAVAMGGEAAFRCAHFGPRLPGDHPARAGVSMIGVPDLSMPIALSSSGGGGGGGPKRASMAAAFRRVAGASQPMFEKNPGSLRKTYEGMHTLINALERPPPPGVRWAEVAAAYGLVPGETGAQSFASQLAGAELMIRAGANVVTIQSMSWDHHGEWPTTRDRMVREIIPGLSTFLSRSLAMDGFNVITALTGEFARTGAAPGAESGHANGLSASLFGKYVQKGTTGRPAVGAQGGYALPPGTPGTREFWGLLSTLARSPARPFGGNAHPSLVVG